VVLGVDYSSINTLYLSTSLLTALPFDPRVEKELNLHHAVLVTPCHDDVLSHSGLVLRSRLGHRSFSDYYKREPPHVMSLHCYNDPWMVYNPKQHGTSEPTTPQGLFEPLPVDFEKQAMQHIEDEFKDMKKVMGGTREFREQIKPIFLNRHYWKDVSQGAEQLDPPPPGSRLPLLEPPKPKEPSEERKYKRAKREAAHSAKQEVAHSSQQETAITKAEDEPVPPQPLLIDPIYKYAGKYAVNEWDWTQPLTVTQKYLEDQRNFRAQLSSSIFDSDYELLCSSSRFHPLDMDAYRFHPSSLSCLAPLYFDGVDTSYMYGKCGFQFFNLHIEQLQFPFVHHQLTGESLWYLIPPTQLHKLDAVALDIITKFLRLHEERDKDMLYDPASMGPIARIYLLSKQLFPPLSLLQEHGVKYLAVRVKAGQVLMAHGGYAHFGFSTSPAETNSLACNVVSLSWLQWGGLQFLEDYWEWVSTLSSHKLLAEPPAHQTPTAKMEPPNLMCDAHASLPLALNTCPPAYTCRFLHGLLLDLQAEGQSQPTVVDYSSLDNQTKEEYRQQIQRILIKMHTTKVKDFLLTHLSKTEKKGKTKEQMEVLHHCDCPRGYVPTMGGE
jgi:hypothetical protein